MRQRFLAMTPKYQVQLAKPMLSGHPGVKTAQQMTDDWLETAGKKGRPMSPHLSVYKWSIPMTMSAFNRVLAIPVLDLWTGDAVVAIANTGTLLRETPSGTALVMGLKASVFFPFFYHTFIGMRHWSWDIFAVGIRDMAVLYQTGYIAIAAAFVLTAVCVLCRD